MTTNSSQKLYRLSISHNGIKRIYSVTQIGSGQQVAVRYAKIPRYDPGGDTDRQLISELAEEVGLESPCDFFTVVRLCASSTFDDNAPVTKPRLRLMRN